MNKINKTEIPESVKNKDLNIWGARKANLDARGLIAEFELIISGPLPLTRRKILGI